MRIQAVVLVAGTIAPLAVGAACATDVDARPSQTAAVAVDETTRDDDDARIDVAPTAPVADDGVIALVSVDLGGEPNAPTAPWGREDLFAGAAAPPPGMFDESIHDATGAGGLRLSGVGAGAGTR